jgi:hypothetical protein
MSKRLSDLNACSRHDFVAALGNVFEYAPWIVEQAAAAGPFDRVQHLFNAMKTVVDQTTPELRLVLIREYPDLANKAQRAAGLTAESNSEHGALDSIGCRIRNLRRLNDLTVPTARLYCMRTPSSRQPSCRAVRSRPLRAAQSCRCGMGGRSPRRPPQKNPAGNQGDNVKDARTLAISSARVRRAASASSISTLTNFTGVLGCSWPIRSISAEMTVPTMK